MKKVLLILAVILLFSSSGFSFSYEEEFHQAYDIPKGGSLSLNNITGNVEITVWDRNEVDVLAIKRSSRSKAELKKVTIEVDEGKSMEVRAEYQRNANVGVDFEIKVPAGIRLERIETVTGNIDINGASNCDHVKLITGNITIRSDSGPLKAELITGNLKVYLNKISSNANYSTVTGPLDVYLNPAIEASIDANTVTGSINNHGLPIIVEELSGLGKTHFRGTLGNGGPRIGLQVITGGIGLYKLQAEN